MIKKNPAKLIIGLLCVLVLLLAVVVAVILDSQSPDPILGVFQTEPDTQPPTEETTDATQPSEEQLVPPEDLPATVVIPTEKDPETGKSEGVKFPCKVPEYGLVIEKIAPYNGVFVENGSNVNVENVAMLMVHNDGDFPVEYTKISVSYEDQTLLFDISALPVGQRLVVQESTGKPIPEGIPKEATAMVVQRVKMEMSEGKVRVTDNGDNTLTVENLTDKTIPTVRVFYKYYMEQEDVFVGGIAFTVRVTRLGAGKSITVQPAHYTSQTGRVVMVLTYDSEV